MARARSGFALSCLLLFVAQPARAFLDPPYVTPQHPLAGETIHVNIYGGVCDIVDTGLQPPLITREGNAIRIAFFGTHFDIPELCTIGVGTAVFPIGAYDAASYTLRWIGRTRPRAAKSSSKYWVSFRLPSALRPSHVRLHRAMVRGSHWSCSSSGSACGVRDVEEGVGGDYYLFNNLIK